MVALKLRIGLFIIAALLLAAHFFRAGNFLLVALCLVMPFMFLHKRRWSLVLLQSSAYLAAANWLWVAFELAGVRQQSGRPWGVAAAILSLVVLFTLLAGLLLNSRCLHEHYRSG